MKELQEYAYPCAWYVIQRLQLNLTVQELYEAERIPYTREALRHNDILFWKQESREVDVVLSIKRGIPLTTTIIKDGHFGVYEARSVVSDLTIENVPDYMPIVRCRHLDNVREPDYIVRPI